MRRSAFVSLCTVSLVALVAACATSPADDPMLGADVSAALPGEPTGEGAKLPPSSTTAADAGTATKDAAPPADAGSPPAQDAGTPPPPPPPTGAACDPSDPLNLIKFLAASTMEPCPCPANKCCYEGLTCL